MKTGNGNLKRNGHKKRQQSPVIANAGIQKVAKAWEGRLAKQAIKNWRQGELWNA